MTDHARLQQLHSRVGATATWFSGFLDGQQHTGVLSNRVNEQGRPLVIHNGSLPWEKMFAFGGKLLITTAFPRKVRPGERGRPGK